MKASSLTSWRALGGRFLLAFLVASIITGGSFASAYWYANNKVGQIERETFEPGVLEKTEPGKPGNFLIVGSDTRAFVESEKDAEAFGSTTETGGQRSDTIMVVHVDPGAKSGMVMSFPRDLYVDVVGRGPSKINAAYNEGPQNLVLTIAKNFDIPIHHYLEVDFKSFQKIVDAIGGVKIYFPTPARDTYTGLSIPLGGCAPLDGEAALAYARSRHYQSFEVDPDTGQGDWSDDDPRADIGRIARQQYFMRTIAQTAISKAKRNPLTAKRLLDETIPSLRADEGLDLTDLQHLASTFRNVDPTRIPMETIPFTQGESYRLYVDDAKAEPLLARMRSFTPVEKPGDVKTPQEPPDVDAGDVSVRVLNGSGEQGVAGDASEALGFIGFDLAGEPGDADSFDHDTTQIRYSSGNEKAATLLLFYLGGRGELVQADDVNGVDVELVVGRDYAGVGEQAALPSTSSTSTSTTQPPYLGDPIQGLPSAQNQNASLPLVGCPPGT